MQLVDLVERLGRLLRTGQPSGERERNAILGAVYEVLVRMARSHSYARNTQLTAEISAEEIASEALMEIIAFYKNHNEGHVSLTAQTNWAWGTAWRKHQKHHKRQADDPIDEDLTQDPNGTDMASRLDKDSALASLISCLKKMQSSQPDMYQLLIYRYREEKAINGLSKDYKVSTETIRKRLRSAEAQIRTCLGVHIDLSDLGNAEIWQREGI